MLASDALSHLTVLDLTRVRAGPTAVRQLADWGAHVIKIEMPASMEEGDGVGGPREGSDFNRQGRLTSQPLNPLAGVGNDDQQRRVLRDDFFPQQRSAQALDQLQAR